MSTQLIDGADGIYLTRYCGRNHKIMYQVSTASESDGYQTIQLSAEQIRAIANSARVSEPMKERRIKRAQSRGSADSCRSES